MEKQRGDRNYVLRKFISKKEEGREICPAGEEKVRRGSDPRATKRMKREEQTSTGDSTSPDRLRGKEGIFYHDIIGES